MDNQMPSVVKIVRFTISFMIHAKTIQICRWIGLEKESVMNLTIRFDSRFNSKFTIHAILKLFYSTYSEAFLTHGPWTIKCPMLSKSYDSQFNLRFHSWFKQKWFESVGESVLEKNRWMNLMILTTYCSDNCFLGAKCYCQEYYK